MINEQLKNLKIDPKNRKGSSDADLMLIDEKLKGLSKQEAEKLRENISKQLKNATKDDRDYLQHIDDVLTNSSQSIPGYVPEKR